LKTNDLVNLENLREREFPITKECIYLDHAAMSPLPVRVKESLIGFHYLRSESGANFPKWWEEVEVVRQKLGEFINASNNEIALVPSTSIGINMVANGLPLQKGDNVIITDLEFPSNVYPWLNLKERGIEIRFAKNVNGEIPVDAFESLIDENTKAISISFVEAGNGYKNDLQLISNLCKQNDLYFIVDAIQGLGIHPIDVKKLEIDFLISGFFKWMFGPDGIAFLYCKQSLLGEIKSPFVSWTSMEDKFNYTHYSFQLHESSRRFEIGNHNFSGVRGVHTALDLISEIGIGFIQSRTMELANYLRNELNEIRMASCLSNFKEDNQSQILLVDCENIDVIHAGLLKENIIVNKRNGLRVSPHFYNTKEDLDRLLDVITHLCKRGGSI
jgi:cysteine desulfurase/selenocysteine lyase